MEKVFSAVPARYIIGILGFLGMCNIYAMRFNLSVAIVSMVSVANNRLNDVSDDKAQCSDLSQILPNQTSYLKHKGEFNWDSKTQSLIHGAFFYGYILTQIPGGLAVDRFGGKWFFGISILITSILTLLTPLAARTGIPFIIAVRFIQGLSQGVTYPAITTMISVWVPKLERSRMCTVVGIGEPLGSVVAMALSGYLISSDFLGGWPSAFYTFGILGCIWFIFWTFLVFKTPKDHPRISQDELFHIQENEVNKSKVNIPWIKILTSFKVWVLAITYFAHDWGLYCLLTELPTYLSNVLHFNIEQDGYLSSIPFILQALTAVFASIVADMMRRKNCLHITSIRKLFNSIGFFGPSVCFLSIIFIGCQPIKTIVLLCLAMGLNGISYSGHPATLVDMSPEFSGTIIGLCNVVSNISGILAPFVTGKIIANGQTLHNWGLVFAITSAIYFLTGILFNLFASAELQPWSTSTQQVTSIEMET